MANLLRGLNQYVQNPPAPAPINVPAPLVIQAGGQVLPPAIKKSIATPDTFDGQSKHWKTFKNQINTFIQANSVTSLLLAFLFFPCIRSYFFRFPFRLHSVQVP